MKIDSIKKILPIVGPIIVIVVWLILDASGIISPFFLPKLSDTIGSIIDFLIGKGIIHILFTLFRTLLGFLSAAFVAIPLGLYVGTKENIYKSFEILIDFFRSIPASAIFPLFLLLFGIGDTGKIAITSFTVFWAILVNTIHGAWNVSQTRIKTAQVYGASKMQIIKNIIFFDSLPQISVGLRIGLSLSLIIVIVAETFTGSRYGIGKVLFDSYVSYNMPNVYGLTIITGILGYSLNKIYLSLERKVIHWSGK